MRIRVEDGHGRAVGMLEIDNEVVAMAEESGLQRFTFTLSWDMSEKHMHGRKHSIELALCRLIPYGWTIRMTWKTRSRLERAGLFLPYEEIIRDKRFLKAPVETGY